MEYLMTYGWAILIIAVVLAALFELGVFNPMTFAPKASPGSCQVVRPEGAGTTNFISLEGECNGELPQYAAQFNGQSNYIAANIDNLPVGTQSRTMVLWVNLANTNYQTVAGYGSTSCYESFDIFTDCSGSNYLSVDGWCTCEDLPPPISAGTWYFVAEEYNGTDQIGYLGDDGQLYKISAAWTYNTVSSPFYIGKQYGSEAYLAGEIANVQLYNSSLSSSEIQALYREGIGGAPIKIQDLIAWWPLNGNADDYSGNSNNGVPTSGVSYTTNWYSGYSAP